MLLNVHSYFSLRYGTLSLEQLIDLMRINDYDTAVLTDINNSSGVLDFIRLCRKEGINGLAGMEFRNGNDLLYIGVARNQSGFKELNELITKVNREKVRLPEFAPPFNNAYIIYPFGGRFPKSLRENEYIGVRPSDLNRMAMHTIFGKDKYVVLQTISYEKADYTLHKQLRSIDHNLLISQLQPLEMGRPDEVAPMRQELLECYRAFPHLIQNTLKLLGNCTFNFDFKKIKNKALFTGSHYEDQQLLYRYAMEGLAKRYHPSDEMAKDRVLKELEIIDNLHFSSYFLITDDICRFARSRSFHYVGRGSGANSVVAYCLGITDVDPIALNLYFERFLNPKRKSSPDFDIDFAWNERDDVYGYIFQRYPQGHVALMGAMSTFRGRSIIRELGKVYGLPKQEIDRLIHEPQHLLNKNEVTDMILSVNKRMADFPNQRSIHASGVLIAEEPLTNYSGLDCPPKGLPTVQFDMYVAEDIGFEKFDILSQRGIGHIKDCKKIVEENRGEAISTDNPQRFFNDPNIAQQLQSANTIGCFYIESPAMRQLLSKLRCNNYLTLVAASSIIRPGVASSGMMKAYIERHHDPSNVQYIHPLFKEQLEETYGVMVYQEDVMKIGHSFGGLDLADADVLRRMMSGKYRHSSHLQEIRDKFFDHCQMMNYQENISCEVWRQMESFAGYSFNKAHSASYAVESYQSLYLKTYYPLEFMVAVLNNYGGFYNRKVYVEEAKKVGGNIYLPCINNSMLHTTIKGKDIYLGLDFLLNFERELAVAITQERLSNGIYTSLENFITRTNAKLEQLLLLIRCGAFRFTGIGKKELLWEAHLLDAGGKRHIRDVPLFASVFTAPVLPKLEHSLIEDIYDELELIGFPVSASLFDLARSSYRGDLNATDMISSEGKTVRMVGDFVCDKDARTKTMQRMKFGTFFDSQGHFFDTVHFPQSLSRYPLMGSGLYLLEGKVVLDFDFPILEVTRCAKMPLKCDPRSE